MRKPLNVLLVESIELLFITKLNLKLLSTLVLQLVNSYLITKSKVIFQTFALVAVKFVLMTFVMRTLKSNPQLTVEVILSILASHVQIVVFIVSLVHVCHFTWEKVKLNLIKGSMNTFTNLGLLLF